MSTCPYCHKILGSGEECRFLEATGYCWGCYPEPENVLDLICGTVGLAIQYREGFEPDET